VAEAIIESARTSGDFESVIKKFVIWLSKHITPGMVEKKRDPSRFIEKLFDSFRKEEFGISPSKKEAIIEECSDDIKTAMVEEAFLVYRTSAKKGLGLVAKILGDEEDQKRILPNLSKQLVDYGVQEEDARSFVQQVETELSKDEEVAISKKKLDRLLKVSERYEQELNRQVRVATEELTKMNKRLADEKERSEGIMHLLSDGLVVVDKSGKIVMMNPAAEKLLGKEMKESVGRSLVEGLDREHLLAMTKGALKEEGPITKEIELNSKDEATKRVLRASSAVVENEDGKTVGMVSVLTDITREKEVDEMKSHFISLVTHELRTPVVAIQKSLDLILSKATGAINEDQEKFLSISKFNLERLNRLINDLLDLSKLEAGKFIVQPVQFDFRDVIKEVKSSLTSWIKDKEINVHLDLKEEPVIVLADRDRMMQVMINLISNALKFTPVKGEVSIVLTPLESKEGICAQSCIEVIVADTGIGIDPKDFKRIFNKFEQVSLVSPSGVGGTGLGLPIAKEIIHLHGGQIWVESQQGKGSKFIFVIPRIFQGTKKEK
jgi:PAS domain S-box-containing protein